MKTTITITTIKNLTTKGTIWDTKIKGFGARLQKNCVSYILKTRINGRQKLITIGRNGNPWTPASARNKALSLLSDIANGIDPTKKGTLQKHCLSVQEVWDKFNLDHICKLKLKTRENYLHLYKQYIAPSLSSKLISDISREDVAKIHQSLSSKSRTANHMLAVTSKFMNWAEDLDFRKQNTNPTKGIKRSGSVCLNSLA